MKFLQSWGLSIKRRRRRRESIQSQTGVTSDSVLIRRRALTGWEDRDDVLTPGIKAWIHSHSFLSTWLQQWSADVTSMVGCLCSVMLTVDWKWRGNYILLHKPNITERKDSLVSALYTEIDLNSDTQKHVYLTNSWQVHSIVAVLLSIVKYLIKVQKLWSLWSLWSL